MPAAAAGFVSLADQYRSQLRSNAVEPLLRSFDRVVIETLCPTDDEHITPILLEADRLEDDVGPDAVVEHLEALWGEDPRLREKYVETLCGLQNWAVITDTLKDLDEDRLARGELEALILADASTRRLRTGCRFAAGPSAAAYDDKVAKLFRRQLYQQFAQLRHVGKEHK